MPKIPANYKGLLERSLNKKVVGAPKAYGLRGAMIGAGGGGALGLGSAAYDDLDEPEVGENRLGRYATRGLLGAVVGAGMGTGIGMAQGRAVKRDIVKKIIQRHEAARAGMRKKLLTTSMGINEAESVEHMLSPDEVYPMLVERFRNMKKMPYDGKKVKKLLGAHKSWKKDIPKA